jgi:Secretion system C-terminal sorting domain
MYVGFYYDLVIVINDTPQQTYIQNSAFLVTQPPASIAYVSPASAYNSLLDTLQIQGLYTSFLNGPTPTISFQLHGTTEFTAGIVNVLTGSSIRAFMTVPSAAPAGIYDVIASNGIYSDTGKQEFNVLGPEVTVTLVPDSGAGSTMFDVSIVGQNTNFAPTTGASLPLTMTVYLIQDGVTYYQATADTVFSGVLAHVVFTLPDSIAPGIYDAEVFGYTYNNSYYDLYTTFLVTPSVTIGIHSIPEANPGDTITLNLTGTFANFIYQGNQQVKTVRLVAATDTITAESVTVMNDTTLSSSFAIPHTASAGEYAIDIIEPGTNRTLIGPFIIMAEDEVIETTLFSDIINAIHIFPNPAQDNASISFTMAAPSPVQLLIYDALGRTVASLCDRELGIGVQNFEWLSDNVPNGNYFYEIIAGEDRYGGRIVVQH